MRGMKVESVQPDMLIEDRLDLGDWGVNGYAMHTPGHSPGSLTLIAASGEAVTGDMVAGGKKPSIPNIYYDFDTIRASIAGLAEHKITKVYTSHAGVYDIADVLNIGK
jgi:hydroxyacylglutathione hydrolase